jgi:hypothetical protein
VAVFTNRQPIEITEGIPVHFYQELLVMSWLLEHDTLRLFRPGDECDPTRNGKTKPERSDLPEKYRPLLDWYEKEYCSDRGSSGEDSDPVLQMWGVGKEIWADEGGDAFIERERNSWGE